MISSTRADSFGKITSYNIDSFYRGNILLYTASINKAPEETCMQIFYSTIPDYYDAPGKPSNKKIFNLSRR